MTAPAMHDNSGRLILTLDQDDTRYLRRLVRVALDHDCDDEMNLQEYAVKLNVELSVQYDNLWPKLPMGWEKLSTAILEQLMERYADDSEEHTSIFEELDLRSIEDERVRQGLGLPPLHHDDTPALDSSPLG